MGIGGAEGIKNKIFHTHSLQVYKTGYNQTAKCCISAKTSSFCPEELGEGERHGAPHYLQHHIGAQRRPADTVALSARGRGGLE